MRLRVFKAPVRWLVLKWRTSNPQKYWEDDYAKDPDYMEHGWSERDRKPQVVALKQLLSDNVPKGGRVLEVGANNGYFASKMRGWGYEVTQTDTVKVAGGEQYDVSQGTFRMGYFDAVVGMGMIHHVYGLAAARRAYANLCLQAPVVILSSKFVERVYDSEIWVSRRLSTVAEWLPKTHRVRSLVFAGRLDLLLIKRYDADLFDDFYDEPMKKY